MAAIFLVNKIHLEMPAGFEISFFQALFERKYLKSIII